MSLGRLGRKKYKHSRPGQPRRWRHAPCNPPRPPTYAHPPLFCCLCCAAAVFCLPCAGLCLCILHWISALSTRVTNGISELSDCQKWKMCNLSLIFWLIKYQAYDTCTWYIVCVRCWVPSNPSAGALIRCFCVIVWCWAVRIYCMYCTCMSVCVFAHLHTCACMYIIPVYTLFTCTCVHTITYMLWWACWWCY